MAAPDVSVASIGIRRENPLRSQSLSARRKVVIEPQSNPYAKTVVIDDHWIQRVYVSGLVAMDAEGDFNGKNDRTLQTECILNELQTLLADRGGPIDSVVRVTVYATGDIVPSTVFNAITGVRRRIHRTRAIPGE